MKNSGTGRWTRPRQTLEAGNALQMKKSLHGTLAETDVSIRPGWFYHEEEDGQVRSFENLKDIYLKSVGGNTTLLLNLPPMKNGRIHETDAANLKQLGEFIENTFKYNLVDEAGITSIPPLDCWEKEPTVLRNDDYETYFMNEVGTNKLMIKINWIEKKKLNYLVLKEAIPFSQRVEKFKVCYEENESMKECYNGTTIGYKKIIDLKGIQTDFLAIVIEDSRVAPVMSFVGVY